MYQSSPNDEVLANINMSTMTGTLTQLVSLSLNRELYLHRHCAMHETRLQHHRQTRHLHQHQCPLRKHPLRPATPPLFHHLHLCSLYLWPPCGPPAPKSAFTQLFTVIACGHSAIFHLCARSPPHTHMRAWPPLFTQCVWLAPLPTFVRTLCVARTFARLCPHIVCGPHHCPPLFTHCVCSPLFTL